jgi:enoyl-CoA hydratase
MSEEQQVTYEVVEDRIARITLDRPEKRNAQGADMTYQLDAAIRRACLDDSVHVIILGANGDMFSAGHDLSSGRMPVEKEVVGLWGTFKGPGWEGKYSFEKEVYFEMLERWRNAPKPMIAEVHGSVIAAANMLVWACDIVVCSEDARFRDNTLVDMSMPGVEVLAHPFELGVRKAKEWMFTGGWISAHEAEKCGMVNHVVPRDALREKVMSIARKTAENDLFALKLMKESMNHAEDSMGRRDALRFAFANHQIGHTQNMLRYGFPVSIEKLPESVRKHLEAKIAQQKLAAATDAKG